MIHPTWVARYRRIQELHRSIHPPGELTALTQLERLDPHGVMALALEMGEERAVEILKQVRDG